MYFEVLNNVQMTLKALTPLLDPILGQNVELGFCVERMEVREMLLLGPFFFSLTLFSSLSIARGLSLYVTRNRVKE
jgi:hypothetical protein